MRECTEECQQAAIECIGKASKRDEAGEVNWIFAVTCNEDALPEGCNISEPIQALGAEDMRAAQNADPVISRVLTLKKDTYPPETQRQGDRD